MWFQAVPKIDILENLPEKSQQFCLASESNTAETTLILYNDFIEDLRFGSIILKDSH